jgi:pSer/pThr/pTyr-binding forkhead associated (FHA) protein
MSAEQPAETPAELTANVQLQRCPRCSQPVAPGSRFCHSCGSPLARTPDSTGVLPAVDDSGPLPAINPEVFSGLGPGDAVLVVHRGPNEGTRFELVASPVTVGREPEATIFLDDVTVSRHHADFTRVHGGWELTDAGSLNGTYTNRARIDTRLLVSGDEVQIGKYRFLYFQAPTA